MAVIALWSPSDYLLSVLAPLALASSRRSCLVVDLDADGPPHPAPFTLSDLVADGPTAQQLAPAVGPPRLLPNGGVMPNDAADVVGALVAHWPNVVLRCPPSQSAPADAVQLVPLLPSTVQVHDGPIVFQDIGLGVDPPSGATTIRRPRRATVEALANHRVPVRSRWVRDLATIWRVAPGAT